jgi:hypothetical protein
VDTKLSLSTASPSIGGNAPQLTMERVDFERYRYFIPFFSFIPTTANTRGNLCLFSSCLKSYCLADSGDLGGDLSESKSMDKISEKNAIVIDENKSR